MEDKKLTIIGTIMTVTFNILAVIFSIVAFRELSALGGWLVTVPLCAAALWADIAVCKYYINKMRKK